MLNTFFTVSLVFLLLLLLLCIVLYPRFLQYCAISVKHLHVYCIVSGAEELHLFCLIDLHVGFVSVQFCMFCSTGYHIFRCHSERSHIQWLALDMTGISVGILGCYLPAIHYGFYCRSASIAAFGFCSKFFFAFNLPRLSRRNGH